MRVLRMYFFLSTFALGFEWPYGIGAYYLVKYESFHLTHLCRHFFITTILFGPSNDLRHPIYPPDCCRFCRLFLHVYARQAARTLRSCPPATDGTGDSFI